MALYGERANQALPWTARLNADTVRTGRIWGSYFQRRSNDLVTPDDLRALTKLTEWADAVARATRGYGVQLTDPLGEFAEARREFDALAERVRTLRAVQQDGVAETVAEMVITVVSREHAALLERRYGSLAAGTDALRSGVYKTCAAFVGQPNDDDTRRRLTDAVTGAAQAILGEGS